METAKYRHKAMTLMEKVNVHRAVEDRKFPNAFRMRAASVESVVHEAKHLDISTVER